MLNFESPEGIVFVAAVYIHYDASKKKHYRNVLLFVCVVQWLPYKWATNELCYASLC